MRSNHAIERLLRQCQTLEDARRLHSAIAKLEQERHIGALLVQTYGKLGSLQDAKASFDRISERNGFTWTALLGTCSHNGSLNECREVFEKMPERSVACWNSMMSIYGRRGYLEEAKLTFDSSPERDIVSWNIIIGAFARNGQSRVALDLLTTMRACDLEPNRITYINLIDACSNLGALEQAKAIHAAAVRCGHTSDNKVTNALVHMYGKCGSLDRAREVFDGIQNKDVFSWTAMLTAYAKNGEMREARKVFGEMPVRTLVSWNAMIGALTQNGMEDEALEMYQAMDVEGVKRNGITFVTAVNACANLGLVEQGEGIHERAASDGYGEDSRMLTALVNFYGKVKRLDEAVKAFWRISKRDVVCWTSLLGAYGNCGVFEGTWAVFEAMPQRTVVSWSGMVTTLADNGWGKEALFVFQRMQLEGLTPDELTFLGALDGCNGPGCLKDGRVLHSSMVECGFKGDMVLGTAIIGMYGRCGCVGDARKVFEVELGKRDLVSWSAIITAYVDNGQGVDAVMMLARMDSEGVKPDELVLAAVIEGCASVGALIKGLALRNRAEGEGFSRHAAVQSSLICLYGKCGCMDAACRLFAETQTGRDPAVFHAMMSAYFHNGLVAGGLSVLHTMEMEGVRVSGVTFLEVLNACAHLGSLFLARHYFLVLKGDYAGLVPTCGEHYGSMVDSLARAGRLQDAAELLENMPFQPDTVTWTMLLGASSVHGDAKRATAAAEKAFDVDPRDTAPYILLSNSLAS